MILISAHDGHTGLHGKFIAAGITGASVDVIFITGV